MAFDKELKQKLAASRKRAEDDPEASSALKFTNDGILVRDEQGNVILDTGDALNRLIESE